ncbi:MAG: hypothetical protein ABJA57_08040 [Ginsengibacter sp.]
MKSISQQIRTIAASDYDLISLQNEYGKNKHFVHAFELQSLIALSHYPELKNSRINFRLADKESMAKTTITFWSLFFHNKHIVIYINKNPSTTGLAFSDLPFNAQVGAIAHELAHAADFKSKNLTGMVWWGVRYTGKTSRIKIERNTDCCTIQHGMGWQLYDFTNAVTLSPAATTRYKLFKEKYYLSPGEIREQLSTLHD